MEAVYLKIWKIKGLFYVLFLALIVLLCLADRQPVGAGDTMLGLAKLNVQMYKVVGVGGQLEALRAKAGPTVEILGWRPDDEVLELYRTCRLLVFPGEEDFGIVPLEAQACGRPVVAYGKGGALETIRDGVSGVFFPEQTEEALAEAVERAADMRWDADDIRANAEAFGPERFLRGLAEVIRATMR